MVCCIVIEVVCVTKAGKMPEFTLEYFLTGIRFTKQKYLELIITNEK